MTPTTATRQLLLLRVLVALTLTLGGLVAGAATAGAQNAVAAINPTPSTVIEAPASVSAGGVGSEGLLFDDVASGCCVAPRYADDLVDLSSSSRRSHILDGEVLPGGRYSGGHRAGTGFPRKSEFPASWTDDQILHHVSDIATDPSLTWRAGRGGDFWVNGTRNGIDIEVLIRNDQIWTAYPTNVPRNPG